MNFKTFKELKNEEEKFKQEIFEENKSNQEDEGGFG